MVYANVVGNSGPKKYIILNFSHFLKSESKEDIADDSPEEFVAVPLEDQYNFLLEEFDRLLTEIKTPSENLRNMFKADLMREDFVF